MKSITLHPASVLVGCAATGLTVMLLSAAQAAGSAHPVPTREVQFVGEIPAEWWTYVEVNATQSYIVPAGHYFVVTTWQGAGVDADGQSQNSRLANLGYGSGNNTRVPFSPGTVLTGAALLWGYLEPVR